MEAAAPAVAAAVVQVDQAVQEAREDREDLADPAAQAAAVAVEADISPSSKLPLLTITTRTPLLVAASDNVPPSVSRFGVLRPPSSYVTLPTTISPPP